MEVIRPEDSVVVLEDGRPVLVPVKQAEGTAQDKEKMDETIPF